MTPIVGRFRIDSGRWNLANICAFGVVWFDRGLLLIWINALSVGELLLCERARLAWLQNGCGSSTIDCCAFFCRTFPSLV